ncbi:DUF1566 domain-containing protein [Candidatus Binatia bacterium]|nr:DUF1566 domain-containing protein [Candidatus Binatia bacterium]
MRRSLAMGWLLVAALLLSGTGGALAGPTAPQGCEAAFERASGKLARCRLVVEAGVARTGSTTRRAEQMERCETAFDRSIAGAVKRFGNIACPVTPGSAFSSDVGTCTDEVAIAAHGGSLPTCGDGAIDVAGEQCDGADLGGSSCESLGRSGGTLGCSTECRFDVSGCATGALPATGQTSCWNKDGVVIPCAGSGHDGEIQAGADLAYVDHGDGTITDRNTGLTWEQLDDAGGLHDKDTLFDFDAALAHVAALNAASFAGHTDWRLANARELQTLIDDGRYRPAIAPAFNTGCTAGCSVPSCSCTKDNYFWSSTSLNKNPSFAWYVNFFTGERNVTAKSNTAIVRAVRGGR